MTMDKLRKEVREALDVFAGEAVCMCHEAYTSRKMKDPDCNHHLYEYVETIRAELLRLAEENAENRWERGRYPGKITQHWLRAAFDRIAAGEPEVQVLDDYGYAPAKELAALRKRIAGRGHENE